MAPILPGITDDPSQLREVVKAAIDAGATHVSPIMLHLRPVVREEYMQWLAEHFPELVPRYERMYRTAYGSASDRNELGARVTELIGDEGGLRPRPGMAHRSHRRPSAQRKPAPEPEQLSLLTPPEPARATARIARGRGGRGYPATPPSRGGRSSIG